MLREYDAPVYQRAKNHFKKADPHLYKAAQDIEIEEITHSTDLFRDIVWTIIGQQLSSRAADAIFARFVSSFADGGITPERVLNLPDERMRGAGLSMAKVRAIRAFALAVEREELLLAKLFASKDEEVVAELTKVKGIGPWTAEMVLMFSLGRPDIFSRGDLGLRKGIMELYGLRKPPSERRFRQLLEAWSPYRTYAARILWKISDQKTKRVGRKRATK